MECFLRLLVVLLSLTSIASGLTLELYHKSHPNISHHFVPTFNTPYRAEISISFPQFEYVIHFSIGTPPFKTFAVFDTGSPVFWLQTSTCDRCMPQPKETLYDVNRSSTFEPSSCNSIECGIMIGIRGGCEVKEGKCTYSLGYVDGTNSTGYVATDVITFMDGSVPGRNVPSQVRLLMGVGTRNYGVFRQGREMMAAPGIFGMSFSGRYQLTHSFQTGQFSYCMPVDPNKVGYVKFGEAAEILGETVKLVEDPNYKLGLTGISLNDKPLESSQESWDDFTMVIDTGTPVSRMHPDILDAIQTELEDMFGDGITYGRYEMCWYNLTSKNETVKNMTITLHFGDLDFKLYQPQIWQIFRGDGFEQQFLCINFIEHTTGYAKESILGTIQTTNKNIAINVLLREASIEDRIC